jgi:predicted DNA-binding protein (UPF0251 family)
MPRCKKDRCCRRLDGDRIFKPTGVRMKELESVDIILDEFEAIRLCDLEGKSQIEASEAMGVSRGTIQRLLNSGRKKIVDALLNSKAINIKDSYIEDKNCKNIK